MAGPSGAGAVQAYLRSMRGTARRSAHREYRAALRKEVAKSGRHPDLVEFDCFFLCMTCGHLAEPLSGDPMRSQGPAAGGRCPMCGEPGLVDLRHTPTVCSLSALEASEPQPSRWRRAGKVLGVLSVFALVSSLGAFVVHGQLGDELGLFAAGFILAALMMMSLPLLPSLASVLTGVRRNRRVLPRRWRLSRSALDLRGRSRLRAKVRGRAREGSGSELLRAPLSGRPCLAYEVAVRDDASAARSYGSWRLVEQDNVGFRVDDLEVGRGQALLRLPRELASRGMLMSQGEATQRFMRMRGLLETEDVHVYETILAPGAECRVGRCEHTGATEVFA
jgi:hypothetical protein